VNTDRFKRTDELVRGAATLRMRLGIPSSAFTIGFVGRLTHQKGILELAEAWRKAAADEPGLHLLLVAPPEIDPLVVPGIAKLTRNSRVHRMGFQPDPRFAYAAMDLLVLPSHELAEGLPNVILEAGSMEVPVLATRVAGCRDAVVPGRTGILVEAGDPQALADAMIDMSRNREGTRRLGRNGRSLCLARFRQQTIWGAYVQMYCALIGGSGPGSDRRS